MWNSLLLLLLAPFFIYQKKNVSQCNEVNSLKKSICISNTNDLDSNYDNLYLYKSPNGDVIQKLYVKYDLENYIKYKLVLVKTKCKLELVGEAEANQELDGEIDEDADGNAYMAIEFKHQTEQFYLSIRIAEDKEKVKISYAPTLEVEDNCPILTDILMYSE